jgi:BMFP domain-containing protein YqiC
MAKSSPERPKSLEERVEDLEAGAEKAKRNFEGANGVIAGHIRDLRERIAKLEARVFPEERTR